MRFLRRTGGYNLQEALSICEKKQLHREHVYLLGRINLQRKKKTKYSIRPSW